MRIILCSVGAGEIIANLLWLLYTFVVPVSGILRICAQMEYDIAD